MAFAEIRLSDDVERGAVGGPGFKTRILTLDSGHERRNIDWEKVRGSWDISYGLMKMDDDVLDTTVHDIRDFFYAREGAAHGFRFKDWSDFEIGDPANPTTDNQQIGLGDDSTVLFQIFKRYSSGGINYDRPVVKIVSGTVNVLLDNVPQADPGDYSIDLNTGLITFVSPPASTGGSGPSGEEVVEVALEFDVPVRFEDDHLQITTQIFNAGSVPALQLIELRED
jgi:uncharacterized protein (TIGR02217 family)